MKKHNDPRHLARRYSLQVLFAWTANGKLEVITSENKHQLLNDLKDQCDHWYRYRYEEETQKKKPDYKLARNIIKRVINHYSEFDQQISQAAPEWPLSQISGVDLTILRMAMAELTGNNDTPYKVVIDEAVELGKEFGGENSSKFINGVLGTIVEKLGKVDEEEQETK